MRVILLAALFGLLPFVVSHQQDHGSINIIISHCKKKSGELVLSYRVLRVVHQMCVA